MNCFNHRAVAAIGTCKSCGKALCAECLVEVVNGLACKGQCEDRVRRLNALLDQNLSITATANKNIKTASVFRIVFGLAFVAFGLWFYTHLGREMGIFFIAMGMLLIVFGIYFMRRRAQYPTETQ